MLLIPPIINAFIILQQSPLAHDNYIEQYVKDEDLKDVNKYLMHGTQTEEKFVFHRVKEFM